MARCIAFDLRLFRAILLGSVALALANPAAARIGVTSATDGDPLGKPPSENERVLRIGIDVQANEVITTKANDRAHLVFLDGTSITIGPNARMTLDKFVYDPDTKKGELALTATTGVFRIVGGKISKTNAITVTTPSSTIGIRGGISIFTVTNTQTVSTFVFGQSLTVSGGGQTQTLTRAGTQVVTNFGGTPGNPAPANVGGGVLRQAGIARLVRIVDPCLQPAIAGGVIGTRAATQQQHNQNNSDSHEMRPRFTPAGAGQAIDTTPSSGRQPVTYCYLDGVVHVLNLGPGSVECAVCDTFSSLSSCCSRRAREVSCDRVTWDAR